MIGEALVFGLIGLAIGSFVPLVAERIDTFESFFVGRSHCNHCKRKLEWYELIPVASWLALQGRCRTCRSKIAWWYPFVELFMGVLFFAVRYAMPEPVNYWYLTLLLLLLTIIAILFLYDAANQLLPVPVLAAGAIIAILIAVFRTYIWYIPTSADQLGLGISAPWGSVLGNTVAAGLIGAFCLALLVVPSRGRWMGYGDIILAALLGLWLGYPGILIALVLAFYLGAIIGILLIVWRRYKLKQAIAFGPFLIAGAVITYFWGGSLFTLVMHWWGYA